MNFKKAIISKNNTHVYDPVNNLTCKMLRVITPNKGVQFSDDKLEVFIQVYGQIFETQEGESGEEIQVEKLFELPQFSRVSDFSYNEINGLFKSLNDSIDITEDFMVEFNKMLNTILLLDTKAKGLFGGDDFEIYNQIE